MCGPAGAEDCPLPAAALPCGALQVHATAPCQQLCCSVWPYRCRRLPLASSCAALWSSAGAEDCLQPTGVRVCKALQVQKIARSQQVCCSLKLCKRRRLPQASRCVGLCGPAYAAGCLPACRRAALCAGCQYGAVPLGALSQHFVEAGPMGLHAWQLHTAPRPQRFRDGLGSHVCSCLCCPSTTFGIALQLILVWAREALDTRPHVARASILGTDILEILQSLLHLHGKRKELDQCYSCTVWN